MVRSVAMTRNSPYCLQFINRTSGSNLQVGIGIRSCTEKVQLADEYHLDGRPVALIDTPGFDDILRSETEVLKLIKLFLDST